MYRTAIGVGVSPTEFWEWTPVEVTARIDGWDREQRMAWVIAANQMAVFAQPYIDRKKYPEGVPPSAFLPWGTQPQPDLPTAADFEYFKKLEK